MSGEHIRQQVADLYVAAYKGAVRYLVMSGIPGEMAAEAVQDAFLRLYQAWRKGEEIREPRAWVYRVARNAALNSIRSQRRLTALPDEWESLLASSEASAEANAIEAEWMEGFREALRNLSERQRLCLELRAQGMRYREIAAVLDIRISTVAEYVRRGIEELKKWSRNTT
jgi:RNA polymerase sigma-70 factor (ECF subfamily)